MSVRREGCPKCLSQSGAGGRRAAAAPIVKDAPTVSSQFGRFVLGARVFLAATRLLGRHTHTRALLPTVVLYALPPPLTARRRYGGAVSVVIQRHS